MTILMVIMAGQEPFTLVYDPRVNRHLRAIDRKYHSLIRTEIREQLRFEPDKETRNRKPLVRPVAFEADWELRFGPDNRFRVLYGVDPQQRVVEVLAIGVKRKNRLTIGGEEVVL